MEQPALVDFARADPREGHRRLTFMMPDQVVAVSPASVYRVLRKAGRVVPEHLWDVLLSVSRARRVQSGHPGTRTPFSRGHTMSQAADVLTNYGDDDLTFFALTYKDYDATAECLADLRKHYSASRVILRSDGDPDPRLPILAKDTQVDFRGESRLFGIENGGAVIERMLVLFLEKPTRYLLKIDPDTVIHRRFRYLPVRSGLFGTLQGGQETPSVQGGCIGFTRDAAEQILQSQMLRDSRLREPAKFIDDSPYFVRMTHRANRCGLASFDWILPWIASELGIPLYSFYEVNSDWQQPSQRYAVSHPRAVFS